MIYDLRGRQVRTLVDGTVEAGLRTAIWNGLDDSGSTVASGTYFYRLETEGQSIRKKMLLLK